ncbi:cytochrome protein, partial [Annulohypoxylon truncatum]|uniref:cytochrome protein n=1 Tax=Annulohypoxylon truncatum TaxID=327061 RepID=UPI0020085717
MFPLVAFLVASSLYVVALSFYRLYFHPLAGVPGPKLAALTGWYEAYYDLVAGGHGGQMTFHIQKLHKQYGKIVRINPHSVHIDDADYFSAIYTAREGFDRPEYVRWRFGSPHALISTPDHHAHKLKRKVQEPFFAKGRIAKLAPMIWAKANKMCRTLSREYAGNGRPVRLDNMFACLVADVATQYSFDRDYSWLEMDGFESPFLQAIVGFKKLAHPATYFPWMARALVSIPDSVVRFLQPSRSTVLDFQDDMRDMVRGAQSDVEIEKAEGISIDPDQVERDKTIIHGILRSGLPGEELEVEQLKDHAAALLAGGVASTVWTLSLASYHIINDRDVMKKLRAELEAAMPDSNMPLTVEELGRLPYLMACIDEALRLAPGQMARSPRISKKAMVYGTHTLPAGTHISLDAWHMHHNEAIFPSSFEFRPERWLNQPQAPPPYEARPLKAYLVSFSRGTRNCLGLNLANAEMSIALAALFRRFDWELFETTYDADVKVVRDLIAPEVPITTKGIRALVTDIGGRPFHSH